MDVLAFSAVKGGVGKTTAAVNVAAEAARQGHATLLWDLDHQASACHLLGVRPLDQQPPRKGLLRRREYQLPSGTELPGLSVLPANLALDQGAAVGSAKEMNRVLDRFRRQHDLVILDLPAGVDSAVEATLAVGASVIVPILPSLLSVRTFDQFASFSGASKLRGFVNMVDPTLKRHADFVTELAESRRDILSSWIPSTVEIERACEQGAPVASLFPHGRAARAFAGLWNELSTLI